MAHTKSAKKRHRQSLERRTKNRAIKSELRTLTRAVREAAAAGKVAESEESFRKLTKRLDQAAAKGAIHKNSSARTKSRVSATVKKAKGK